MQDYFDVNISYCCDVTFTHEPQYLHYCTIKLDAVKYHDKNELQKFIDNLRKLFTAPEFKIDVTLWQCRGYSKAEY